MKQKHRRLQAKTITISGLNELRTCMGGAADPQLQRTSQTVIISVRASVEDLGQTMNSSGLPI